MARPRSRAASRRSTPGATPFCRADWRGPPKPTADDFKTAKANEIKLKNRIITREMWCADEGADWQDIDDQLKREKDNADELEIDTSPAADAPAGGGDGEGLGEGYTEDGEER